MREGRRTGLTCVCFYLNCKLDAIEGQDRGPGKAFSEWKEMFELNGSNLYGNERCICQSAAWLIPEIFFFLFKREFLPENKLLSCALRERFQPWKRNMVIFLSARNKIVSVTRSDVFLINITLPKNWYCSSINKLYFGLRAVKCGLGVHIFLFSHSLVSLIHSNTVLQRCIKKTTLLWLFLNFTYILLL